MLLAMNNIQKGWALNALGVAFGSGLVFNHLVVFALAAACCGAAMMCFYKGDPQ
jgi:hypothetical protein